MKKTKICILMVLAVVSFCRLAQAGYTCGVYTEYWCNPPTNPSEIRSIGGSYETSAEAQAAAQAAIMPGCGTGWGCTPVFGESDPYLYDGNEWDGWVVKVGANPNHYAHFIFPESGSTCYQPDVVDSDGDGLDDPIDPYPDDPSEFSWSVYAYQEDTEGNYTYFCMETDRGDRFCYGEQDPNKTTWTTINDPEKQSVFLLDYLSEGLEEGPLIAGGYNPSVDIPISTVGGDYETQSGVSNDGNGNTQTGTGNDGNTTETDYLADIVENTQKGADNQGVIKDYLADIVENTQKTTDNQGVIAGALSNIEGGINTLNSQMALQGAGPTANEIGGAVANSMNEGVGDAETQAIGDIEGMSDEAGFTEEDKPEENFISDVFDSFMTNNPVAQYLSESGVEVAGACCSVDFEWNFGSQTHTASLSMCEWEEQLQTFGGIFLAVMGLVSLLVVFRG